MRTTTILVLGSTALVAIWGCYRCVDPQCSNVPPVEPDYPTWSGSDVPTLAVDARAPKLDAGADR